MPLNPAVAGLLAAFAEMPQLDFETGTPEQVRAIFDNPVPMGEPPAVARVVDFDIALAGRTIAARLYVPAATGAGDRPPLTMYFHGGGWVIGTIDTHDPLCRALANASGSAVLSVAYRLAPEHPYPAAAEDCYDACVWAVANGDALCIDAHRLAVAGDSAGGNLAAAVAIMARDRGGPAIRHQLLIYPVTDIDFDRASYLANGGGDYYLSTAGMKWFWGHYLGEAPASDAPLAVIIATPDLSALPPASVITAEYDPLRDEGDAYAARLIASGVSVDAACAPGMIHGFFSLFQAIPDAQGWIERAGANLRRDLAPATLRQEALRAE